MTPDYERGFQQAIAGHPLVRNIEVAVKLHERSKP